MKPKKGSQIELQIQSLIYGGQGIGEREGFKIFVDKVAPQDKVLARVKRVKSKYAEAELVEVLEESPLRTSPRCKHFERCGGCKWQFFPYEEQLKIKEVQVRDSMLRLGGLPGELVEPILGDESPWYYRNKMDFSFGPGSKSNEGPVMLGLYPPGYHFEVFDLEECFLESLEVPSLVKKMRDFAHEHDLSFYNSREEKGLLRNFTIREGKNTGERMVILSVSDEKFPALDAFKNTFGEDPLVSSLYLLKVRTRRGQKTSVEELHLAGKNVLTETLKMQGGEELSFEIKPQAFFQTNTKQAERLYQLALDFADLTGDEVLYDLYCGTGTIGLFCAGKAKQVFGVEMNASAVENAKSNAVRNGISNAEFVLGDVDEVLRSGQLPRPDLVMVDPPRLGLGPAVTKQCADFGANKIVYISCNPTTMARDLKQFSELGYETQKIKPVDMFPQTHHVECVAVLNKKS